MKGYDQLSRNMMEVKNLPGKLPVNIMYWHTGKTGIRISILLVMTNLMIVERILKADFPARCFVTKVLKNMSWHLKARMGQKISG